MGLLGGMECRGDSLFIDHSCGLRVATVVCRQKFGVSKHGGNDIWKIFVRIKVPERPTVEKLTWLTCASVRVLQWVAAGGVSRVVLRRISSICGGRIVRGLPERGTSFSIPATPCSTKRSCHRATVCRVIPKARAIS